MNIKPRQALEGQMDESIVFCTYFLCLKLFFTKIPSLSKVVMYLEAFQGFKGIMFCIWKLFQSIFSKVVLYLKLFSPTSLLK